MTVCTNQRPSWKWATCSTATIATTPTFSYAQAGFIYYDVADGRRRVAPELYVAFDVDKAGIKKNLTNYWIWEVGKSPDLVLEVASPSTVAYDLGDKRDLYAQLGITEYWRLDALFGDLYGQPLTGERLVDGEYQPYELHTDREGTTWAYSEVLDLCFVWELELEYQFDIREPGLGRTINRAVREREARLTIESREKRAAWVAEQGARLVAQSRRMKEASAWTVELLGRHDAEARERELRAEFKRLRRQLP